MSNPNTISRGAIGGTAKWKTSLPAAKNGKSKANSPPPIARTTSEKAGFLAFQAKYFVLIMNIKISSVRVLSINHKVCITEGCWVCKIAKNIKSKIVLIKARAIIKGNTALSLYAFGFLSSSVSTESWATEIKGKSVKRFAIKICTGSMGK